MEEILSNLKIINKELSVRGKLELLNSLGLIKERSNYERNLNGNDRYNYFTNILYKAILKNKTNYKNVINNMEEKSLSRIIESLYDENEDLKSINFKINDFLMNNKKTCQIMYDMFINKNYEAIKFSNNELIRKKQISNVIKKLYECLNIKDDIELFNVLNKTCSNVVEDLIVSKLKADIDKFKLEGNNKNQCIKKLELNSYEYLYFKKIKPYLNNCFEMPKANIILENENFGLYYKFRQGIMGNRDFKELEVINNFKKFNIRIDEEIIKKILTIKNYQKLKMNNGLRFKSKSEMDRESSFGKLKDEEVFLGRVNNYIYEIEKNISVNDDLYELFKVGREELLYSVMVNDEKSIRVLEKSGDHNIYNIYSTGKQLYNMYGQDLICASSSINNPISIKSSLKDVILNI